jgi:hypothetical protein
MGNQNTDNMPLNGKKEELARVALGIVRNIHSGFFHAPELIEIAQNSMLALSDYWMSYSVAAMIYWYADEREKAEEALITSLHLDHEKTCLFMALLTLSEGRNQAADEWINLYIHKNCRARDLPVDIVALVELDTAGKLPPASSRLLRESIQSWTREMEDWPEQELTRENWWKKQFEVEKGRVQLPEVMAFAQLNDQIVSCLQGAKFHTAIRERIKNIMELPERYPAGNLAVHWLEKLIQDDVKDAVWTHYEHDVFSNIVNVYASYAFYKDVLGIAPRTKKFFVASAMRWISRAYEDVCGESVRQVPDKVKFYVDYPFRNQTYHYTYEVSSGREEKSLAARFKESFQPEVEKAMSQFPWGRPAATVDGVLAVFSMLLYFMGAWAFGQHMIMTVLLILAIGWFNLGFLRGLIAGAVTAAAGYELVIFRVGHPNLFLCAIIALMVLIPFGFYLKSEKQCQKVREEADSIAEEVLGLISEACTEMADFRHDFASFTKKGAETRRYIHSISPDMYLPHGQGVYRG